MPYAALFLVYAILPGILYGIYATTSYDGFPFETRESFSVAAGCVAYIWLLMQVVLAVRLRWIERKIPLDRLYRIHGAVALLALGMVTLHAGLKSHIHGSDHASTQHLLGQIAFGLFTGASFLAIFFLGDTPITRLRLVRPARDWLARALRLGYRPTRWLHNLAVPAVLLMYLHILLVWGIDALPHFKIACGVLLLPVLALYLYHQWIRPWRIWRNPCAIHSVETTGGVTTLTLAPEKPIAFEPGQLAYLHLRSAATSREAHPFTLACPPGRDEIRFSIKASGDATRNYAHIAAGDRAAIDGPYGGFTLAQAPAEAPLLLVAGGIGITPFLSMVGVLRERDPGRHLLLLWSARREDDFIRLDELRGWIDGMPKATLILHATDGAMEGANNRLIAPEDLHQALARLPAAPQPHAYVCGPEGMMQASISALGGIGLSSLQIHFERFSL